MTGLFCCSCPENQMVFGLFLSNNRTGTQAVCFDAPQVFFAGHFVALLDSGNMDFNLVRKFESLARRRQWKFAFWIPLVTILLALLAWQLLSNLSNLPS